MNQIPPVDLFLVEKKDIARVKAQQVQLIWEYYQLLLTKLNPNADQITVKINFYDNNEENCFQVKTMMDSYSYIQGDVYWIHCHDEQSEGNIFLTRPHSSHQVIVKKSPKLLTVLNNFNTSELVSESAQVSVSIKNNEEENLQREANNLINQYNDIRTDDVNDYIEFIIKANEVNTKLTSSKLKQHLKKAKKQLETILSNNAKCLLDCFCQCVVIDMSLILYVF